MIFQVCTSPLNFRLNSNRGVILHFQNIQQEPHSLTCAQSQTADFSAASCTPTNEDLPGKPGMYPDQEWIHDLLVYRAMLNLWARSAIVFTWQSNPTGFLSLSLLPSQTRAQIPQIHYCFSAFGLRLWVCCYLSVMFLLWPSPWITP